MKAWEDMTNKERAEQTIRDIKRRQESRRRGEQQAKAFCIECAFKTNLKARQAKTRGCRSCR